MHRAGCGETPRVGRGTDIEPDEPAYYAKSVSASRVGKAVEYLIAASCILATGAELNVSTALVDDEGVDLVFHRRGRSQTIAAQVKSRTTTTSGHLRGRFVAFVRHETFRPRPDLYLLFVLVDAADATYGPVWLVPSADFARIARHAGAKGRLRFSASTSETANDQWRFYRLTRTELPAQILDLLSGDIDGRSSTESA